jgi:hypothetical protein
MIAIQEIHIEPEGGLLSVERLSSENGRIISNPVLPTLSVIEVCANLGLKNVNTNVTYYKFGEVSVDDFTLLRWTCSPGGVQYGIAYKRMVARIVPGPSAESQVAYLRHRK